MLEKVKKIIEENNLIEKGDRLVVAVSGGPDSVVLLHVLNRLKETYDLKLYVCHLNHMLRGQAADGDADYVAELCQAMAIPCFVEKQDIHALSKEMKMSFEEAAREARYDFFNRVLETCKAQKIAVAQNMNDQAETLLMRLFRGSGLEGLTAIKFKRDQIIRPLLGIKRDHIEAYCQKYDLKTRTDHTNFETLYTRNKIRLDVLPMIKERFNDQIIERLYETTLLLQDDLDFIESHVNDLYKKISDYKIPLELLEVHPSILSRLIRRIFLDFKALKNISAKNIQDIMQLIDRGSHGKYLVYGRLKFEINYQALWIYEVKESHPQEILLEEDRPFLDYVFHFSKDEHSISIDADKVKHPLTIRTRRAGDRFSPLGMTGQKKLKDFFIDLKVPAKLRNEIPLICDGETIVWVVGYRMSEAYKLDPSTQQVMHISYKKMEATCK